MELNVAKQAALKLAHYCLSPVVKCNHSVNVDEGKIYPREHICGHKELKGLHTQHM